MAVLERPADGHGLPGRVPAHECGKQNPSSGSHRLSLGHEQAGRRPALVLSPRAYNARTGLAMVCPISSKVKGYPFEVILPEDVPVQGVVLSDQLRTVDWRERRARRVCRLSDQVVEDVRRRVATLV